MSEFGKF